MKHCFKGGAALLALALSTSLVSPASAQNSINLSGSGSFSLQGRLLKQDGSAITNGVHQLAVNLYQTGTNQAVFSEMDSVTTVDGVFSTMINRNGNANLNISGNQHYEIGVAVDGQSELLPHIMIGKAPQAITASVADSASTALNALKAITALNANAVGGFRVDSLGQGLPHSLVTLNNLGKLGANVLDSSIVTSLNGMHGNVNIMGGGSINVTTTHDSLGGTNVNLGFTGSNSGLSLPFSQTLGLGQGDAFSITNSLAGNAAAFTSTGTGNALRAVATSGSAILASSTGGQGSAAINATSTLGTAINATSGATSAITASTTSSTNAALDVTNSATGGTAAKLNGGLSLVGPIGTGTINLGQASATISNAYAKANSMIFITLTSASGLTVPLTVTSVGAGTFTVSTLGLGNVTSAVNFNYLIVNQ